MKALLVVLMAGALAAPAGAAAQSPLPISETDGVRIVRERGALVVVFSKSADRLLRRVQGRMVSVFCTEFVPGGEAGGGTTMRAPKRGRKIRTGDLTRGMDYCRVWLESRTVRRNGRRVRTGKRLIVSIPLTQKGAVYLDEQEKTGDMMGVLAFASHVAEERGRKGTPTADELLSAVPPGSKGLVGLAGPAETPPAGAVGYWSDGAEQVAVVTPSASGRRLFIEYEADVLHTNVANYIYGDLD